MILPNVPGAMFIPGATSIPESRVHNIFYGPSNGPFMHDGDLICIQSYCRNIGI